MPYYCTVPRCTSMAGKAKNVSFHQFPRDEELAKLWNRILKRGKPYTKYSKVCSLHFKPEDYTITSVGKNKGQWRTLRKDAIPSQNLPSDAPSTFQQRNSSWGHSAPSSPTPNLMDPLVQQQMAQAIYMQTMLTMQAGASDTTSNDPSISHLDESTNSESQASGSAITDLEQLLLRCKSDHDVRTSNVDRENLGIRQNDSSTSYQCQECSKCFKDPDVFILHRRVHAKSEKLTEKENFSTNIQDASQETLRANPILANLLKSTFSRQEPANVFDVNNVLSVENQIMAALASNMEAYIRTLSSMLNHQNTNNGLENGDKSAEKQDIDSEILNENLENNGDKDSEVVSNNEEMDFVNQEDEKVVDNEDNFVEEEKAEKDSVQVSNDIEQELIRPECDRTIENEESLGLDSHV